MAKVCTTGVIFGNVGEVSEIVGVLTSAVNITYLVVTYWFLKQWKMYEQIKYLLIIILGYMKNLFHETIKYTHIIECI